MSDDQEQEPGNGLTAVLAQEKQPLYFASNSADKFDEYRFLVGSYAELKWFRNTIEEAKTLDFGFALRRKIQLVKKHLPYSPFLVEQTGLVFHAWNQLPGPSIDQFLQSVGADGICKMINPFEDNRATAVTYLGYHTNDGKISIFQSHIQGTIAPEPRGDYGYGWEILFIPDGHCQTLAEMSLEKRSDISTQVQVVSQLYATVFKETIVTQSSKLHLRNLIVQHFNLSELRKICFTMDIDHEELPGQSKTEKVQELIRYCERHVIIDKLLTTCRVERPNVKWNKTQISELPFMRLHLRTLIFRHFNQNELKQLTISLKIDYGELGEGNRINKIQELILYCDRRMILPQLLAACRAERPRVDWPVFA